MGTLVNGDFISHYAHLIHDPLYAKALILQDVDTTFLFIVVDICLMRDEFIDDVKKEIENVTGIEKENILISSTHTHAAGAINSAFLGEADLDYRIQLKQSILRAAGEVEEKLRPAKIAFGKIDIPEHVVCRRYYMKPGYQAFNPSTNEYDIVKTNPGGLQELIDKRVATPDPELCFMAIKDTDDNWISLLANYSLHYVGDWEDGTITADYFGVFSKRIKSGLGASDDFVAIMTNGTSGDVNIVDFLQPDRYPKENFKKSELIGNDIADRVVTSMDGLTWEKDPSLKVVFKHKEIAIRKPGHAELQEAIEIVKETRYEQLAIHNSANALSHSGKEQDLRRIYAREQIFLDQFPDYFSFPIHAIKVGSGVIGGLGGEFFAETGIWLKKNSQLKNYFTICLANSYVGYVPPEEQHKLGGYETWRSRVSFLSVKAEEQIREQLLEMIKTAAVSE